MVRGKIRTASILLGGAVLCTAAHAQPIDRQHARAIEAAFSTNDALNRSMAHVAVASTVLRPQDGQLSQADLFSLMVLLSFSKKHPS